MALFCLSIGFSEYFTVKDPDISCCESFIIRVLNVQVSARLVEAETDRRLRILRSDSPWRLAQGARRRVSSVHVSDAQGRCRRSAQPEASQWRAPTEGLRHRQRRSSAADIRRRKTLEILRIYILFWQHKNLFPRLSFVTATLAQVAKMHKFQLLILSGDAWR